MESSKQTTPLIDNYAPNPVAERAYATFLAISKDKKWLGYCTGNVVILRNLENLTISKIFIEHRAKTSAIAFSPTGVFAASGDVEGNIKIWFLDDFSIKKEFNNVFGGKINGIEWNDESNKLLFYGEGKQTLAKVINWDMGNNIGEIGCHTKTILSGDIKKSRPYRIATGSEDHSVNFYEGVPFKYIKSNKEHSNFVSGVRFSPNDELFVSVGFDRKIVMYDGKDGSVKYILAQDRSEGNHTGAIIGVSWINNETIVTGSLDKTIKVWDLNEKVCKFTLYPSDKDKLDVPDMCCGIINNGNYIISLTLNGKLNFWKIAELSDEKLPDIVIDGHQNYISNVLYLSKTTQLISTDFSGKVLLWDQDKKEKVLMNQNIKISSLTSSPEENLLYTLNASGEIVSFDLVNLKTNYTLKLQGDPQCIRASRKKENKVYALFARNFVIIEDGVAKKEFALNYDARALEVNEDNNEVYIGDYYGVIHIYDLEFNKVVDLKHHQNEITVLRLSNNGNLIASGDSRKNVYVWDPITKEMVISDFIYHTCKVFDIRWAHDDSLLVSGGLDKSIIIWNLEKKSRLKVISGVDNEVVNTVTFGAENKEIFFGGHSCTVKKLLI